MNIIDSGVVFRNPLITRTGTEYIVLHHAAAKNCTVEDVHSWHLANGWAGIGYHYFVRKNGEIYTGRPHEKVGAHCPTVNYNSVAICFEGNFETEEMPEIQLKSGAELIKYLLKIYPDCKIVRHCDKAKTACPGKNFPFTNMIKYDSQNSFYRVCRSITNMNTQIGAFVNIENAKKACLPGCIVLDPNGNVIYENPYRASDARNALRQAENLEEDTGIYDVDGDGKTTAKDARNVSRNVR